MIIISFFLSCRKRVDSLTPLESKFSFFPVQIHHHLSCDLAWWLYRDTKRRGIYLALFTNPEGDSCFSIYQISWIKMKKVTFWKLKTPLSRNLIYNLQTFLVFWRFCCKFSLKYISYLPVNTDQPKIVGFLVFVCTTCFINRSNFVFRKFLEARRHFGSGRKGYSELLEPIKS